jgi:hypothetical protein
MLSSKATRLVNRAAIREKSAAEILGHLKEITLSSQFDERVQQLYVGRLTQDAGWQATVAALPQKLPSGGWMCGFNEVGSGTLVIVSTAQDISVLRPGDSVNVGGRISGVNRVGKVTLEDAIIRSENVTFP